MSVERKHFRICSTPDCGKYTLSPSSAVCSECSPSCKAERCRERARLRRAAAKNHITLDEAKAAIKADREAGVTLG